MTLLRERFQGCLLGAAIGDMIGAAVEAESPGYIFKNFSSIEDILAVDRVAEFTGPDWLVGNFTDDTQMATGVAEWLLADRSHSPELLFRSLAEAFEPWRRYGPGAEGIFQAYPLHRKEWRQLSTLMFPQGSYGNGSATRVSPVGLVYFSDIKKVISVAIESSRPTHSHSLAYQGAVLQAVAVSIATGTSNLDVKEFLRQMHVALSTFSNLMQDISAFTRSLNVIRDGINRAASCKEISSILGKGITAVEAVPMAVYCFLRHPNSYREVIHEAVFIGGDTDSIACMAGAISGAFLGVKAIPPEWVGKVCDERYSATTISNLADSLFDSYIATN